MAERLSRRGFLQSSVVAGSAAVTGGASGICAGATPTGKPLRIGLMTYNLAKDWDIDTIIKNCKAAKFEHAELRTTHAHGVEVGLSKAQRREVRKRFEDAGLKLSLASAFAYHHPEKRKLRENIEGTKQYTILARDIGAIGIRVFPNALLVDKGIPEEQTLEQIGKALREVGEFADGYGVEIRLGVHGRGTSLVPVIRKILDYADSPHVYVNWNCNQSDAEGAGLEANFNMVKDRIGNIHMHELWEEDYPYRELLRLLKQAGYKGYCDAEIPASCEPVRLMRYYRALFLAYQDAI